MWALACLAALVCGWAMAAGVATLLGVSWKAAVVAACLCLAVQLVLGNLYVLGLARRCEPRFFWMAAFSSGFEQEPSSEPLVRLAAASYSSLEARVVAAAAAPGLWLRSLAWGLGEYRRARGRPGPLDLVGEWVDRLAGLADLPLSAARGRFRRADRTLATEARREALLALLERMVIGAEPAHAFTRGLYRLGPLSWEDALEAARSAAARGWSGREPLGPYLEEMNLGARRFRTHPDLASRLEWGTSAPGWPLLVTPAWLLAGVGLACGSGLLGAPLALGGLGWLLTRFFWLPLWGAPQEKLSEAAGITRWAGVRVRLEGELTSCRKPFPEAAGLATPDGWVALDSAGGEPGEQGLARGWLTDGGGRLVVAEWKGARRRRFLPWLSRLVVPAAVSGTGFLLVSLQMLGV